MKVRIRSYVFNLFWILCLVFQGQILFAQDNDLQKTKLIKIGLLIEDSSFAEARRGAELAVKQINEQGRLKGHSLQLLTRSMEGPWGKGSKQAVDLIFEEEVWALIASSQGRNAHLIEQVIAKTNIVFLSSWATDPTLSKAYVPHFFNCVPNSEQRAEAIVTHMLDMRKLDQWLLISGKDYDSDKAVMGLMSHDRVKNKPPVSHLICKSSEDFDEIAHEIGSRGIQAAVILCEPGVAGQLVQYLRSHELNLPVYGQGLDNGKSGSAISAYAYDALQLLTEAIEKSGYKLQDLRDAVSRSNYRGETGTIQFDEYGNRKGLPELVELDTEIFSIGMR